MTVFENVSPLLQFLPIPRRHLRILQLQLRHWLRVWTSWEWSHCPNFDSNGPRFLFLPCLPNATNWVVWHPNWSCPHFRPEIWVLMSWKFKSLLFKNHSYLQTFEFVLKKIELSHVHPEFLFRIGGIVLATLLRKVIIGRNLFCGWGHGGLTFQQLRGLTEDHLLKSIQNIFQGSNSD